MTEERSGKLPSQSVPPAFVLRHPDAAPVHARQGFASAGEMRPSGTAPHSARALADAAKGLHGAIWRKRRVVRTRSRIGEISRRVIAAIANAADFAWFCFAEKIKNVPRRTNPSGNETVERR